MVHTDILLEQWRECLLGGVCLASQKKQGTIYVTVRSPKHVEKMLKIYSDVENTPKMTIETKTIFDKHDLLPKLYYDKQADADHGIKVIVTGNILPFLGFLQDEELFNGKVEMITRLSSTCRAISLSTTSKKASLISARNGAGTLWKAAACLAATLPVLDLPQMPASDEMC